jgi:tRNA uridine 5-carboxymethylaminomethyl modification enzyme
MFTSRAEYRLLLREDNADQRLTELGHRLGSVGEQQWYSYLSKKEQICRGREILRGRSVSPGEKTLIERLGIPDLKNGQSLEVLLRRPEIFIESLVEVEPDLGELDEAVLDQLEIAVKYEGYIRRQVDQVERFQKTEKMIIPEGFNYDAVSGLSAEVREKLKRGLPQNLGQASRIPGVTPAAVAILAVVLRRDSHD